MANRIWGRCAVAVGLTVALATPGVAAGGVATVDQVLAALAEVVRDRAKQVAAHTIAKKVKERICTGTVRLKPYRRASGAQEVTPAPGSNPNPKPASAAFEEPRHDQPTEARPLILYLGGREDCAKKRTCDADDVFVRSCQLMGEFDVPLSDPYYLKSLSRDGLDFLMRISASNLSQAQYSESGLGHVAEYIHSVLERMAEREPALGALADPTLTLASELSVGFPQSTVAALAAQKATQDLEPIVERQVRDWVQRGCPYPGKTGEEKACQNAPDLFAADVCSGYRDRAAERRGVFRRIFVDGPFAKARELPCGGQDAQLAGSAVAQCRQARLAFNLRDLLVKLRCPSGQPEESRRTLRQLGYVLGEREAYAEALPGDDAKALGAFMAVGSTLKLPGLPREALSYWVRLLGSYFAALREQPEATKKWLSQLSTDLGLYAKAEDSLSGLLHGRALSSQDLPASESLRALRDAVKDFLTLTTFRLRQDETAVASARTARNALWSLIELFESISSGGRSSEQVLNLLATFLDNLSTLSNKVYTYSVAQETTPTTLSASAAVAVAEQQVRRDALPRTADSLEGAARALRLAANRDWVGLAMEISEQLAIRAEQKDFEHLSRGLKFLRTLLAMYQAASVEEAKAIFSATLEDEQSREQRWKGWAVDVTALVGARAGYQWLEHFDASGPATWHDGLVFGLYAPFGVQFAKKGFGLLVYPVDLGTYLTATSSEAPSPAWTDALRLGATVYGRPWSDIPLVFGGGGDVRPKLENRADYRLFVHASLELPLFTIH